jgi:fused signal recognition particle receptor
MLGLFRKFKGGLHKTTSGLASALGQLWGRQRLDASTIESIEEALYAADFGYETASQVSEEIRLAYQKNKELKGLEAAEIAARVVESILASAEVADDPSAPVPAPKVICLLGVNGAGKTTTAAKLGYFYQETGKGVLIGACDTFRAAANEQLKQWSQRLKLDLISSQPGADAAAVAYDALAAAQSRKKDVLLIDTAGRLHTKSNLMEELKKIRRVLQKLDPSAPHEAWLVVDGSIGSNSISQARVFHQDFGLTGLIITKLDGTSRGGALVGIHRELKLPIRFIGLGEKPDDLQPFSARQYSRALFGLETDS